MTEHVQSLSSNLASITSTVNHMKTMQNHWMESFISSFRVVDVLFAKVVQVQQLHVDLIWKCCTFSDMEITKEFIEKQTDECKHLQEDIRSLTKSMLIRVAGSQASTNVSFEEAPLSQVESVPVYVNLDSEPDCVIKEEIKDNNSELTEESGNDMQVNVKTEVFAADSEELQQINSVPEIDAAETLRTEQTNIEQDWNFEANESGTVTESQQEVCSESTDTEDVVVFVYDLSPPETQHVDEQLLLSDSYVAESDDNHFEKWNETMIGRATSANPSINCRDLHTKPAALERNPRKPCEPMYCASCGKSFTRRKYLIQHIRKKHPTEFPLGYSTLGGPHICTICAKEFKRSQHLIGHMRIHNGERPFECATCGKRFRVSAGLSRHVRIHDEGQRYECTLCGRKFTQNVHLTQHMRIHNDEKPYVCTVCEKQFRLSKHLTEHIRIHNGEKPFGCDVCGRKFRVSQHLYRHVRLIHSRGKEKRGKVKECCKESSDICR